VTIRPAKMLTPSMISSARTGSVVLRSCGTSRMPGAGVRPTRMRSMARPKGFDRRARWRAAAASLSPASLSRIHALAADTPAAFPFRMPGGRTTARMSASTSLNPTGSVSKPLTIFAL
jgi:hypothetical protein